MSDELFWVLKIDFNSSTPRTLNALPAPRAQESLLLALEKIDFDSDSEENGHLELIFTEKPTENLELAFFLSRPILATYDRFSVFSEPCRQAEPFGFSNRIFSDS
ncbi:hypothetical protein AYI68_g1029 [Smittium mucronatum]|uniref:Uncharacterized protein n=1 Tax=Smittium mucronatum TaxID=133383 RepID=A0A1R0H6P5_9FUNG|nr:hypothetical protein AYI68_g1029 [Smittium mucronatum]